MPYRKNKKSVTIDNFFKDEEPFPIGIPEQFISNEFSSGAEYYTWMIPWALKSDKNGNIKIDTEGSATKRGSETMLVAVYSDHVEVKVDGTRDEPFRDGEINLPVTKIIIC